ncbi:MAG: stage III sporulation protein AB [Firmicutes bacterium]|nr:stage III sporulation protein AB [Bacillota bacterium]
MRWLGALFVVIAAVWLGRLMARPFRRRVQLLDAWVKCIGFLVPAISWRQAALSQALQEAANTYPILEPHLRTVVDLLATRAMDIAQAFSQSLAAESALRPRDREVLIDMAAKLGSSSPDYQKEMLRTTELLLKELASDARKEDLKQARLLESLISLSGVALVILLL